jgi:hypothetical protein
MPGYEAFSLVQCIDTEATLEALLSAVPEGPYYIHFFAPRKIHLGRPIKPSTMEANGNADDVNEV